MSERRRWESETARLTCENAELRARLAEVEAERDEAQDAKDRITLATTEGDADEAVPWDDLATGVESLRNEWIAEFQRAESAEARLAEVEQALRDVLDTADITWPLAFDDALDRARAVLGKVAQQGCCNTREWAGQVVPCGSCPPCVARAVLDKGEPNG